VAPQPASDDPGNLVRGRMMPVPGWGVRRRSLAVCPGRTRLRRRSGVQVRHLARALDERRQPYRGCLGCWLATRLLRGPRPQAVTAGRDRPSVGLFAPAWPVDVRAALDGDDSDQAAAVVGAVDHPGGRLCGRCAARPGRAGAAGRPGAGSRPVSRRRTRWSRRGALRKLALRPGRRGGPGDGVRGPRLWLAGGCAVPGPVPP